MSGQSPRVADAAPAFVGGHPPSDGEQVGREGSTAAPSRLRRAAAGCGGTASPARAIQRRAAFVAFADNDSFFLSFFFFLPRKNGNGPMASPEQGTRQGTMTG